MAQDNSQAVSRPSIVFLGSPLIDLTIKVDSTFLKDYNLELDNAYAVDESTRNIFDDVIDSNCSVQIGGSVTNTVRAFFKLRPYEDLVTYLGSVGNDKFGVIFKKELEANLGSSLSQVEAKTGKVAVLLNGKARTLVTDLGASKIFSLDKEKWAKVDASSFVYFSGFFIGVSYLTIEKIIQKSGKVLIFNLGAPFLCNKFPQEMTEIYRKASIVFGNQSEHYAFARIHNITSRDLKDSVFATNLLLPNESRVTIVTRGSDSVLLLQNLQWSEFEVTPLSEEKIVDTSGAGDAFVGGFLAPYVDGDNIANCVISGIEMARRVIQSVGFNLE